VDGAGELERGGGLTAESRCGQDVAYLLGVGEGGHAGCLRGQAQDDPCAQQRVEDGSVVRLAVADERMYRDKAGRRSRSTARRPAVELKAV